MAERFRRQAAPVSEDQFVSMMDAYAQECVRLVKTRTDDAAGGYALGWADGAHFTAAWEYMSAPEATEAEKQGAKRAYRIYVDKALTLDLYDVFRRVDNAKTYRVTNPGNDRMTPASSALNRRLIEVEEWELPYMEATNA